VQPRKPRLGLMLPELDPSGETDSVRRTNAVIRRLLEARYEIVGPSDAELVVCGGLHEGPVGGPPRLIFAHGALGDPGHWLLTVPHLRVCDTLALSSNSDASIVERLGGGRFCATARLPLFVDTDFFRPQATLCEVTRQAHGIAHDVPMLLTVSSLEPQKNVQSALLLLRELRRAREDAMCVIAGAGKPEQQAYLEDLTRRLGLERSVRFVGLRTPAELVGLYNAADLFVHLTLNRKENFGLCPVEAQACGVPVLASRWGGVRDSVLPGETGFYAESYLIGGERRIDWLALVAPAIELLRDPAMRERMSANARHWVRYRFSIAAFALRLYRYVDRVAGAAVGEPRDTRRVNLATDADAMLVAFAQHAVQRPDADSRAVSDALREPHAGLFAYRAIHERMVSARPPAASADCVYYRIVDAVVDANGVCRVLDPVWHKKLALEPVARWVWNALARPQRAVELSALASREELPKPALQASLQWLIDVGLMGAAQV
jgi:hypothetical protein